MHLSYASNGEKAEEATPLTVETYGVSIEGTSASRGLSPENNADSSQAHYPISPLQYFISQRRSTQVRTDSEKFFIHERGSKLTAYTHIPSTQYIQTI